MSGGLVTYFLDPVSGEERRERLAGLWKDNQANAREAARFASDAARQIREGRWDALLPYQRQQEVPGVVKLLVATVIGGGLVYFLDPDNGERRRRRVVTFFKDTQERAVETGRQMSADASGKVRQGVEEAGSRVQAAFSR
jgi:hypothetical protein